MHIYLDGFLVDGITEYLGGGGGGGGLREKMLFPSTSGLPEIGSCRHPDHKAL